ncbi:MAG TPA: hypothetical protein VKQ54_02825 [Caulobacteraceae bacterium]|nr:hypothetical protein [Caulobacteraceae bacterium]
MSVRFGAGAIALGLALSGCFASQKPLVATNATDRPFADGASFTEYVNCATAPLLGCSGYSAKGTGSLGIKNGAYVGNPDPGDDMAAKMAAQGGGGDSPFVLKALGGDLYLLQLSMAGGDANMPDKYIYELVQIKGSAAFVYEMSCEENGDKRFVKSGLLTAITNNMMMPTCEADDAQKLAKVFRDRLENGAVPNEKFEFR